jgi:2-methylcitrate dehydratase PrpD
MLTAGRSGRFHGKIPGRSVVLAMAVANGVRAADAAKAGVGGDPGLLDGSWLRDAQGLQADLAQLTGGLGAPSCYTQMSLKPFCTAKQALAAIAAFVTAIDDRETAIDDRETAEIVRVTVSVPPPYARMIAAMPEAGSRSSTLVSAAFQIGLAACHPERLYDIERADVMQETAALKFAEKVAIVADESLLAAFPAAYPAMVEVTIRSGVKKAFVDKALGDPGRPLDEAAITNKAQRVLAQLGETRSAADLVSLGLRALENNVSCQSLANSMSDACKQ